MKDLLRRIQELEKGFTGEWVSLEMPDGHTETLYCSGGHVLGLLGRYFRGERFPELELVAQSIRSTESSGSQLVDLARALINSPQ